MLLALLLSAFPSCSPSTAGQLYTDPSGQVWICESTYWAKYVPSTVTQSVFVDGGQMNVTCTNCGGGSSNPTIDGGYVAVSNFPAMWPTTQVVLIDAGTVDARVSSLPAVVLDGGVNISALPAVVIDGGVNVSNWPATQPVSVATLPASQSQGVDPSGNAQTMLTTTQGVQLTSAATPRPLPLPKCNPVRRYNCQ